MLEAKGLRCYATWVTGKSFKCNETKIEISALLLELGNHIHIGLYNSRRALGLLHATVACRERGAALGLAGDVLEDFAHC